MLKDFSGTRKENNVEQSEKISPSVLLQLSEEKLYKLGETLSDTFFIILSLL